jgi:hypothetical protein
VKVPLKSSGEKSVMVVRRTRAPARSVCAPAVQTRASCTVRRPSGFVARPDGEPPDRKAPATLSAGTKAAGSSIESSPMYWRRNSLRRRGPTTKLSVNWKVLMGSVKLRPRSGRETPPTPAPRVRLR